MVFVMGWSVLCYIEYLRGIDSAMKNKMLAEVFLILKKS